MKIEKEKKLPKPSYFGFWKQKSGYVDVYVTIDGKQFYDKYLAEEWEWYLINKSKIHSEYQFTEISPMALGLHYIVDPIFSYKFFVDEYSIEKENDIILYVKGLLREHNISLGGKNWYGPTDLDKIVHSHIKNKADGWYAVVYDRNLERGDKLHVFYMPDLVTKIVNEI